MDAGFVIIVVAVIALLAWKRWLSSREILAMAERGDDPAPLLAAKERWRLRWGVVTGTMLLIVGAVLALLSQMGGPLQDEERMVMVGFGSLIGAGGLVILIAHLLWMRSER
jgi:hypothetical protein